MAVSVPSNAGGGRLPVEARAFVLGALHVLMVRFPTRTQFRMDARTALWAYDVEEHEKAESNRAARHLRDVALAAAQDPSCIPGWRVERDTTTSKFRFVFTRDMASAAQ